MWADTHSKHELVMPKNYAELSENEMEYDGGIFWSIALSVGGWVCTGVGMATNNDTLKAVGTAATFAGIATTGYGLLTGIVSAATSTTFSTAAGAALVYNSSFGIADAALGIAMIFK